MTTRAFAALCGGTLLLCLCTCLSAQNNAFITGAVIVPEGHDAGRYSVEVVGMSSAGGPPEQVLVQSSGRFEVRNLESGTYTLRVLDERGAVVGGASASTGGMFGPVEIRVGGAPKARVGSGKISVSRLREDPDGKADREMNYGLWYARDKNWDKARKHFEKALRMDSGHVRTLANWAALEMQQGHATEAESLARKGLAMEPDNVRLLHALGVSLLSQGVLTDEAAHALEKAGKEQPKLYLAAAELAYRRGNAAKAHQLAQSYIRTGDTEHLQAARDIAGRTARALPETAP